MSVVFKQQTKAYTCGTYLAENTQKLFSVRVEVHKSMTHACMACSAPLDSLILKIFLGNQGKSCERNLRCSKALSNFSNFWKKQHVCPHHISTIWKKIRGNLQSQGPNRSASHSEFTTPGPDTAARAWARGEWDTGHPSLGLSLKVDVYLWCIVDSRWL